jgi:hypothetical protein
MILGVLRFVVLWGSFCLFLSVANADQAHVSLDHLYPGYAPTVLNSSSDVQQLFDGMPVYFGVEGRFSSGSQCFHRAEIWSYDFYRNKNINAMKVFVFYTFAYKQAYKAMKGYDFEWWFHVAPYVLNKDENGKITETVLDPTFADQPMNMADWGDLFVDTKKPCKEWVRFEDFKNEVEGGTDAVVGTEHCYLVRVPATDFDPTSVEARDVGQVTDYTWDLNQVKFAADHATLHWARDELMQRLGL